MFRKSAVPRRAARTVTFWIGSADVLDYAVSLARAMTQRFARLDVVFVQAEDLPRDHGFDAFPVPSEAATQRMLTRLRTHTLVIGGLDPGRVRRLSEAAARRGSFQVLLAGIDGSDGGLHVDAVLDPRTVAPEQAAERVAPILGSSRRQRLRERGRVPLPVRILRWGRGGPMQALLSFKFREYGSIEALRAALGAPDTLLCLGNGPSSRHPGLETIAYDRLFRVNHSWMSRGGPFLHPDLVFTGQRDTVMQLRPAHGFVFGKIESEEKVLSQLLGSWRRLSYGTAQRLGVYATGCDGKVAPTNGALMIATAVALRPRRLVIAGVDLFSDPGGAYPGDAVTENAYALGHDAALERNFILAALRRHLGELVVFGQPLRATLDAAGIPAQDHAPA